MTNKIIITALLLGGFSASAQIRHEVSIGGGGGLSSLNYRLASPASAKKGLGGEAGAGYTLFFNPNWGVGTGAGVSFFNAKADAAGVQSLVPDLTNDYGDRYELRTTLNRFLEKQSATFVSIPLFLRYVHKGGFYAQAGGKFYIPLSAKYSVTDADLTNKGYFSDFGTEVSGPAFAGFGTFSGYKATGDLSLKTAIAASIEAGWRWKLSDVVSLYTGVYLDFGVNDVRKETGNTLLIPNAVTPEDFSTNSLLASQNAQGQDFSDKVSPLAAGVTVRLAFSPKAKPKSPYIWGPMSERRRVTEEPYHSELRTVEATSSQTGQAQQKIKEENITALKVPISGGIRDENGNPLLATIELTDKNSMEKVASVNSNPQDGTFSIEAPLGKNYDLTVRADNKMLYTDNIDLTNAKTAQNIAPRDITMQTIAVDAKSVLKNIEFGFNQTSLTQSSIPGLNEVVKWLKQNPTVHIEISGHTDNIGTQAVNMSVSEGRAKAVYDFLILNDIAPERLKCKAYGPYQPIATNDTKEGRAKNRRMEMKVIGL